MLQNMPSFLVTSCLVVPFYHHMFAVIVFSVGLKSSSITASNAHVSYSTALHTLCDELFVKLSLTYDDPFLQTLCKDIAAEMTPDVASEALADRIREWYDTGEAPPALQVFFSLSSSEYDESDTSDKHYWHQEFRRFALSLKEICNW
jgi:hypothetical protein